MATPDHKNQAGTEKPVPSGSNSNNSEKVGGTMRSKTQEVLAAGPVASRATGAGPDAPEPDRPLTRETLIDKLNLRAQYEERADHMVSLIHDGLFVFGEPIPSCERVMETFTKEMLELAATFQEPTLLLVPETSFAAKVRVLNATKTMDGQRDCSVDDIYKETDPGSNEITGWKAVIVDGASEMGILGGDDTELGWAGRIANRKAARRKNPDGSDLERGMDRHLYAMLMLEALRTGKPVDETWWTLLDDDPALSDSRVPDALWNPGRRQVDFFLVGPGDVCVSARFRRSVGGEIKS